MLTAKITDYMTMLRGPVLAWLEGIKVFMNPSVLFVDDDPEIFSSIVSTLNGYARHWSLNFVHSGLAALNHLSNQPADVVVLDGHLSGMSGLELCRAIRGTPGWERTQVVMLAGPKDHALKLKALESGATDILIKPIDPQELLARISSALRLKECQDELHIRNLHLEQLVRIRTREVEYSRLEIVLTLSRAAEQHDSDTCTHTLRVGYYSKLIAAGLGLDEAYQMSIQLASPLHDIGKIGISRTMLNKPGAFTPEERFRMEHHCEIGKNILSTPEVLPGLMSEITGLDHFESSSFLELAADISHQHHERWDGTGYPQGLKGHEIQLSARIVAVADVFDALTSIRPYMRAFSVDESLHLITEDSGKHFDPAVVEAFLNVSAEARRFCEEFRETCEFVMAA